jgi:ribosomal protein L23
MTDISDTKRLLDEINAAVSSYDPVMKEQARDILMKRAFGVASMPRESAVPLADASSSKGEEADQVQFNSLIEKWSPTTQADWALLGAYYFQRIVGQQNVTGLQVNKELKQHGYGVTNVTDCFTINMDADPARMLQTKKSGKSKQAKKLYLVTTAGIKYVEDRLNGTQ